MKDINDVMPKVPNMKWGALRYQNSGEEHGKVK